MFFADATASAKPNTIYVHSNNKKPTAQTCTHAKTTAPSVGSMPNWRLQVLQNFEGTGKEGRERVKMSRIVLQKSIIKWVLD